MHLTDSLDLTGETELPPVSQEFHASPLEPASERGQTPAADRRRDYHSLLADPASSYETLSVTYDVLLARLERLQTMAAVETQPPFFRQRRQAVETLSKGFADRLNRIDAAREVLAPIPATMSPAAALSSPPLTPASPVQSAPVVTTEPLALWVQPLLPLCRVWALGFAASAQAVRAIKYPQQG